MKKHPWFKKDMLVQTVVVLALGIFVIAEVSVLIHDYNQTRDQGILRRQQLTQQQFVVEPWMTFSYVNILFNLPSNYLKSSLDITDIRYPNIEIRHYAKEHTIDQTTLINDINASIKRYGVQS